MVTGLTLITEKTKNLLFNGAKAVVGTIWSGEEKRVETPASSQTLLRGQTLIGHDGRLTKSTRAQGETPPRLKLNSKPPKNIVGKIQGTPGTCPQSMTGPTVICDPKNINRSANK